MTPSQATETPQGRAEEQQLTVGTIVSVSGSQARVLLARYPGVPVAQQIRPHVGTLVTVTTHACVVLCLITSMSVSGGETDAEAARIMEVELVGELPLQSDGYLCTFRRGVSVYPRIGDTVQLPTHQILEKAYYFGSFDGVEIGHIHQDPSIPAVIKINEMLGKHFAIVGSTGTGKSCAVALILREFLAKQPQSHIVMVDPHGEYGNCFDDRSNVVTLENLCLPFWFLNFEEIVEILLGDTAENGEEVELLRELIPAAKRQFAANRGRETRRLQRTVSRKERYSVDVPVPYKLSDLMDHLNEQMGRLEIQKDLRPFKRLKSRIESLAQDPRYGFMFGNRTVNDNLGEILKQIFRIPVNGKPITVIQLVGLPSEIVNVVVSVLARLAFDLALWTEGKVPITFVCEEAHRYVPREKNVGFEPTKRTISRIAKEGRKYGVSLCIVSQRPGEIDPTILSQCSTIFTMRLSNERDQQIVKAAVSDAAESLLKFLSSLGTRETIVFGEGVTLPSRVMLSELPAASRPKGGSQHLAAMPIEVGNGGFVDEAIERWRSVGSAAENLAPSESEAAAAQPQAPEHYPVQLHQAPGSPVSAPRPASGQPVFGDRTVVPNPHPIPNRRGS